MRNLNYGEFFDGQLAALELHVPEIRKSIAGVAFALRKDPELRTKVRDDPALWFIPLPDIAAQPLGVSYVFDETEVRLLSIWIA